MAYSFTGLTSYTDQERLPLITKAVFSARSAALAVVETGLAFVQTATIGFNTYANSITYNVYAGGIFDPTFDQTFN